MSAGERAAGPTAVAEAAARTAAYLRAHGDAWAGPLFPTHPVDRAMGLLHVPTATQRALIAALGDADMNWGWRPYEVTLELLDSFTAPAVASPSSPSGNPS